MSWFEKRRQECYDGPVFVPKGKARNWFVYVGGFVIRPLAKAVYRYSVEGLENLDTSQVTDMSGMFWGCGAETLNLNAWWVSFVYNGWYMLFDTAICFVLAFPLAAIVKRTGIAQSAVNFIIKKKLGVDGAVGLAYPGKMRYLCCCLSIRIFAHRRPP